jgi:uncharacterized protein YjbI with pentapeptide repeats
VESSVTVLWGLLALLLIALTQAPRIPAVFSTKAKPAPVAATSVAGPSYSQARVNNLEFAKANLVGTRMAHLDLRGKNFQRADAAGTIFTGSLLNGANFAGADLRGADLNNVCLRGSNLAGAQLAGADFTGADVTGATLGTTATSSAIGWGSVPTTSVCP